MTGRRPGESPRPTLEDVAAAAGVSRSTASRAINGGKRVSPDAQAAVDDAVRRLGFTPNRAARSLVTARADSIALVIGEPDHRVVGDPFFASAVQGLSQALDDTDIQLLLLMAREGRDAERTVRYLRLGHIDGAVVVSHHRSDVVERSLANAALPTVFVGRPWSAGPADRDATPDEPAPPPSGTIDYVDLDNRRGGQLATAHLIERGRRCIGTVAGPADMTSALDRVDGWRDALAQAGLPPGPLEHGDFTTAGGAAATARLLDDHPGIDALFVASDLMAVGALGVLRARGRRVPDDVALVGFDDVSLAESTDPPLTTVVNPVTEMARTAGRILLERLMPPDPDDPRRPAPADDGRRTPVIFPPRLVVRASSGAGR